MTLRGALGLLRMTFCAVCRISGRKITLGMKERKKPSVSLHPFFFVALVFLVTLSIAVGRTPKSSLATTKKGGRQDDSLHSKPAADLALRTEGAHKADAL